MTDWNPQAYLKYKDERLQPAIDLISRIDLQHPSRILDIGCGPGNSAALLKSRWPDAKIIGIDSSPNMIFEAKESDSEIEWILADAQKDVSLLGRFDLVFSNAALQWMAKHKVLIPNLWDLVKVGGAFCAQIPHAKDMEIQIALKKVVNNEKWGLQFGNVSKVTNNDVIKRKNDILSSYYDILSAFSRQVIIWQTDYYHVMNNHQDLVDWYQTTGAKPYLDKLNQEEQKEFQFDFLQEIKASYPVQIDGKVLFPFRRIFMIAYKDELNTKRGE